MNAVVNFEVARTQKRLGTDVAYESLDLGAFSWRAGLAGRGTVSQRVPLVHSIRGH
jgi:hypothetical protein